MSMDFYRAFEDRFRGSRALVKSRLLVYLPFVEPLRDYYTSAPVVDLGCGRGEWLELLKERGFDDVLGVDIDDAMLAACRELCLPVHAGDALDFLRQLPEASQAIVSGFHIVEHLTFATLQELVKEAMRVLKPGGLLILETPNPENLVVGASSFYLDPTHQRPIPPMLLAFLSEYTGFKRRKILRLQESIELKKTLAPDLLGVLNGVSPDYSVVAQKDGPAEPLDALNSAFDAKYGLTLEILAGRYQQQVEARATQVEARATQAEARAAQAEARAAQVEARATQVEARATQAEARATQAEARATQAEARATQAEARATQAEARATQAEARATQAEARATQAEASATESSAQPAAVYASTSWRICAPLRFINREVRQIATDVRAWLRSRRRARRHRTAQRLVQRAIAAGEARPGIGIGADSTPWTRLMASRLEAARAGMKREAQ